MALPALSGFVVCAVSPGDASPERPCPRKQVTGPVAGVDSDAGAACVVLPDAPDAPLAAGLDLRETPDAGVALEAHLGRVPEVPPAALAAPRGPPSGALGALRTVVLRV